MHFRIRTQQNRRYLCFIDVNYIVSCHTNGHNECIHEFDNKVINGHKTLICKLQYQLNINQNSVNINLKHNIFSIKLVNVFHSPRLA